jgi:hypothetical protein
VEVISAGAVLYYMYFMDLGTAAYINLGIGCDVLSQHVGVFCLYRRYVYHGLVQCGCP